MKTPRADSTLGFKKEAVRLVQGGQRQSEAASSPGNWIKADAAGRLAGRKAVKAASDERQEISRLKAELARTRMERDIKKATAYFARESRRDTPLSNGTGRLAACCHRHRSVQPPGCGLCHGRADGRAIGGGCGANSFRKKSAKRFCIAISPQGG